MPERSKGEEGKEEEGEEDENHERKMRNDVTREVVAGVLKEADTVGGGVTRNIVSATQCMNVTKRIPTEVQSSEVSRIMNGKESNRG